MTHDELPGPNRMAHDLAERLPALIAEREAESDPRKRKKLSGRIRASRTLLKWWRSRAGYATSVGG